MTTGTTARLGDVAEIIGGLSSRECPKADSGQEPPADFREAALVPMSAVGEKIDTAKTQRVWVKAKHVDESRPRSARLRAGDLILVNRDTPHVHLVDWREEHAPGEANIRCVPANTLIVVRPKGEGEAHKARLHYLAWLLNHPKTRSDLEQLMRGAEVKSMTTEDLANLVIPLPSENNSVNGTTAEGHIAAQHMMLVELRAKLHEQAELEYMLAQLRLYEAAMGKRKLIP
jgi:hypothetical protein